jgi:hypothetical protein
MTVTPPPRPPRRDAHISANAGYAISAFTVGGVLRRDQGEKTCFIGRDFDDVVRYLDFGPDRPEDLLRVSAVWVMKNVP